MDKAHTALIVYTELRTYVHVIDSRDETAPSMSITYRKKEFPCKTGRALLKPITMPSQRPSIHSPHPGHEFR